MTIEDKGGELKMKAAPVHFKHKKQEVLYSKVFSIYLYIHTDTQTQSI